MILGVTGTNGAGKGAVVDYLIQKGFEHYSLRDLITEEVMRRGLEVNRPNMGAVGTDLRRIHGPAYFTDTFIRHAEELGVKNIVMESIRTLSERENIRAHGGFVIGVNAPEQVRYERITARKTETDRVSFEEFRAQEDAEYYTKDPSDPAQMNVLGVLESADYTLVNDGSLEELHHKIDTMLTELTQRS
jgi:dephospho-CoA kinase